MNKINKWIVLVGVSLLICSVCWSEIIVEETMDTDPRQNGWVVRSGKMGSCTIENGVMSWPDNCSWGVLDYLTTPKGLLGPVVVNLVWRSEETDGIGTYIVMRSADGSKRASINFIARTNGNSDTNQHVTIQKGNNKLGNDAHISGFSSEFITGKFLIDTDNDQIHYWLTDGSYSTDGKIAIDWITDSSKPGPTISIASKAGCKGQINYLKVEKIEADTLTKNSNEKDARMQWWRESRFGMFIHFGLYSILGGSYKGEPVEGYSEWIMACADIGKKEYEKLAPQFNPVKFDAAQWVDIAKKAGAKYIVITSKHHDGFSIYDTKVNDYNIVEATPYGKDLLKPLASECRKAEIAFGIYYSILDWHHSSQEVNRTQTGRSAYRNAIMLPNKKNQYVTEMKSQLRELIEQYDPTILWFDGEWVDWWTDKDGDDLEGYLRTLKPSLIINNRVGKRTPQDGDFGTPEQEIPDTGLDYDWETCMTVNGNWGYDKNDHDWKSTEKLLRNLIDIASKGGNYLLNVGPAPEGIIPQPSVTRLNEIGQWMKINGEAIYGTSASPFERPEWGRYTKKGNYLYAHIFDWPVNQQLEIPAFSRKLKKASLLTKTGPTAIGFEQKDTGITLSLPEKGPFSIASVVALEFEGANF